MSSPESLLPRLRQVELATPLALLLLVLAVVAAGQLWYSWTGLNDPMPLLAGLPARGAQQGVSPPPRVIQRAVLLIADGLNAADASRLQSLTSLRQRGLWAQGQAPLPSFSTPSYVTWLSGLAPADSGVRTNRYAGPFVLDSLLRQAKDHGLQTLGFDEGQQPTLGKLFGPHFSAQRDSRQSWPALLRELPRYDLAVLALVSADQAGHAHGADSPAYLQAQQRLDRQIKEVAASLDFAQDLLIVVNDHGQLPRGGHGGAEPEVRRLFLLAVGAGLRAGLGAGAALGQAQQPLALDQLDLAPTLSLLLGVLPPAHNRGMTSVWWLDPRLGADFFRPAFLAQFQTRFRLEHFLGRQLGLQLPRTIGRSSVEDLKRSALGNLHEVRQMGRAALRGLSAKVHAQQLRYLEFLRQRRLVAWGIALVLGLILLLAAAWARLIHVGLSGLILALLALGAMIGGAYLLGVRPTFSFAGTREQHLWRIALATLLPALAHVAVSCCGQRPGRGDPAAGRILCLALLLAALALLARALVPLTAGAALPDGRLLAASLLAQAALVGYLLVAAAGLFGRGRARSKAQGRQASPGAIDSGGARE